MASSTEPCDQSYDFFSSIETYVKFTNKVDIFTELHNFNEKCEFLSQYDNRIKSNNICQKFQHFYKLLFVDEPTQSGNTLITDYEYLNFWLNYQLRSINNNDYSIVKEFYNNMVDNDAMFKDTTDLHDKICYIQEDIYKNMDILYTLYNNYFKIYINNKTFCGNKESCSVYTEECLEKYKKGIYQCPKEKKDNFCYEIRKLKSEYEAKKNEKLNDGSKISDLMILPERQEVVEKYRLLELRKNIVISVMWIIVSIFGLLLIFFYFKNVKRTNFIIVVIFFQLLINNSHGKWFCNKKNKKREIKENINQKKQRLLYKSEENKIHGNRKEYNILYNS
ncbi:unnamed protein product [Plasmodium vivax]|uniref:(malaria parasite P. vivax) hypothetical protein n=1 Tax=Plasmodium vivax TaxID=5855 RepID=A0A8S4HKJ8_PLAVI|nr:unnamed protein product [Plasmodium vivax]